MPDNGKDAIYQVNPAGQVSVVARRPNLGGPFALVATETGLWVTCTGSNDLLLLVPSADGTPVQLWWAAPEGTPRGTVLEVHGGPNLVTPDRYAPDAQAWLAEGYAYASLNYRGSVTFGRAFREGFWGVAGDREIEDIAAAIGFLRDAGLADPASTFITGASYGGHLSLLAAGRLPDPDPRIGPTTALGGPRAPP